MKKFMPCALFILPLLVAGCGGVIKPTPGSDTLVKLESEPVGCQFLYKLESEVSVYDPKDAELYLRNKIIDQQRRGNSFWIVYQRTRPNEGVVFGPERAYILGANVYDCPVNRPLTKNSIVQESFHNTGGSEYGVYGGI